MRLFSRSRLWAGFWLALVALCATSLGVLAMGDSQQSDIPGKIVARSGDAYIAADDATTIWEIGSNGIRRRMEFRASSGYRLIRLTNKLTGREWLAPGSGNTSELRMVLGGREIVGSASEFVFKRYRTQQNPDGSVELIISLMRGPMTVHLHYAAFPSTNVIEQWAEIENTGTTPLPDLTAWDSFSIALRPTTDTLTLHWVQGLNPQIEKLDPKDPLPVLRLRSAPLLPGVVQEIGSAGRSSEASMGWYVLTTPRIRGGMFGGIEWSGEWHLQAAREGDNVRVRAGIEGIRHAVAPGEVFKVPRRFVGFFRGDLDEAANASHEFARLYLLRKRPLDFPWTQYNTWFAYYTNLNEETLWQEVDIAAELGLELFYVDAGWYEGSTQVGDFSYGLGTWREDRDKFPSGLAAFSKYVHGKGLKFGLWVEPERVDLRFVGPGKDVASEWLASYDPNATLPEGAAPTAMICFGHREAREWAKTWLARLVRDYHLDWLKWDNNAWASCNPPGEPGDGDLAHVQGLYEILDYLHTEFPELIIEDCASGGHRMDYGLLRRTDIAWLSDETDISYRTRYHITGASYPFPAEYLNSWLVESYFEPLSKAEEDPATLRAWLRSRMMGAFGISAPMRFWAPDFRAGVALEIQRYKSIRSIIAKGKQYRLLPQSDLTNDLVSPSEPDAAEFFDPTTGAGVVFLFRGSVPWSERQLLLKGLDPNKRYELTSADGVISTRQTGRQLMSQSIRYPYPTDHPSVWLFIKAVP